MPTAPKPHRPHGDAPKRQYDLFRGTATERGYSKAWGRVSRAELQRVRTTEIDTFCRYCNKSEATMMDHIIPPSRKGPLTSPEYWAWFNDRNNWLPCCEPCNKRKGNKLPSELPIKTRKIIETILAARRVATQEVLTPKRQVVKWVPRHTRKPASLAPADRVETVTNIVTK